jgi:plasmid stabilization system protein ParE
LKKYVLTQQAQEDIDEILEFILVQNQNPDGAIVVLNYLHEAMGKVGSNPNLGKYRKDLTNRQVKFYRKNKAHKYYILFDPLAKPVHIIRVASVSRDFTRLLEESS